MRKGVFTLLLFAVIFAGWIAPASSHSEPSQPFVIEIEQQEPDMPDVSHALLVEHAAFSHGLPAELVDYLSQGAYDEDHCSVSLYPPCSFGIPNGHHSWDPDTNLFWDEPAIWGDFGPGLAHTGMLFGRALEAHKSGNTKAAYLWLGRALHMIGDIATPAHTLLDIHLPWDPDSYEDWLSEADYSNTQTWIDANPPGIGWDMDYQDLPAWGELGPELQASLTDASQQYGARNSGQELWEVGPEGQDKVIFQMMYLLAEEADNFDSDDVQGEKYHGDLSDPTYLAQIRATMFPLLVRHSTALIAYFERQLVPPPAPQLINPQDNAMVNTNPPNFTWLAEGFQPFYQFELDEAGDFASPLISTTTTDPSFTPSATLQPGVYYWRVQTQTTAGTGNWSEIWQFMIPWQVHLPMISQGG